MSGQKDEQTAEAMESASLSDEEPEVTLGPQTDPAGESTLRSGSQEQDSPMMMYKEEAAGDSDSINAMYPEPLDSYPGGLFPGSSSFSWSSPDSSGESRIHSAGTAQEIFDDRASRPGNSRIPGKDHRRYYHNHWRLEYLMDFNAHTHSMICMVCGSSLATLKLSTIKRHIRQKHPYSMTWTPCEKEVIIGSWDAHLCVDAQTLAGSEDQGAEGIIPISGPKKKRRRLPPVAKGTWCHVFGAEHPQFSPDKGQLELYMNESIQQWVRLEFLMDYDCLVDTLHCMMCATTLPSLSLTDIKHHILDTHPTSLQFSPTQKGMIIEAWVNRKESPEEELEVEEEMDDDDDEDEIEEDQLKKDFNDDGQILKTITESGLEKTVLKGSLIGEQKDNEEDVQPMQEENIKSEEEVMEKEKLQPREAQLLEKDEHKDGEVQILEDEEQTAVEEQPLEEKTKKAGESELLEKQQKARERKMLEEQPKAISPLVEEQQKTRETPLLVEQRESKDVQILEEKKETRVAEIKEEQAEETHILEDQQDAMEAQLLEEQQKEKAAQLLEEQQKAKEAQLLEEQGKAGKAQLLEEQRKAMEVEVLEQQNKAKEAQLLDERKDVRGATLLEEEQQKAIVAQVLEEKQRRISEMQQLEEEKRKVIEPKILLVPDRPQVKVVQTLSVQQPKVEGERVVKIEDEQKAEQIIMIDEEKRIPVESPIEKRIRGLVEQNSLKLAEVKLKTIEPKKRIIIRQIQPTPSVLGLGVPVIKVDTPTPIIITRVSVIPERTVLQTSIPSTSTADASKAWRIIAPKLSQGEPITQKTSPSTDSSSIPAGVDPIVWEVSLWRGNNNFTINRSQYNTYQMRWRTEYLMDFNGLRGSVVCMYCCSTLTVLKESSIKRHIIQKHAHTANFTSEEKAGIILDWETKLSEIKKLIPNQNCDFDGSGDHGLNVIKVQEPDSVEEEEEEATWTGAMPEGKGASWEFAFGRLQGKMKDPRKYEQDRWKLEYLMDYTPAKDGLICMVCGVTLLNPKISSVKMHIQQKHPDTTYLSDQEKAVVMEEWEQKIAAGKKGTGCQGDEDEICIEINEDSASSETNGSNVATSSPRPEIFIPSSSKTSKSTMSLPPPCNSAKRNYQVRWRTEFMMDYDCRRQGLICMVCGGTLATLKVSTIKRHIIQVHPYSVDFTAEERQRILEAYSEMALHYIHSEECFKTQPKEETKGRKRKSAAVDDA